MRPCIFFKNYFFRIYPGWDFSAPKQNLFLEKQSQSVFHKIFYEDIINYAYPVAPVESLKPSFVQVVASVHDIHTYKKPRIQWWTLHLLCINSLGLSYLSYCSSLYPGLHISHVIQWVAAKQCQLQRPALVQMRRIFSYALYTSNSQAVSVPQTCLINAGSSSNPSDCVACICYQHYWTSACSRKNQQSYHQVCYRHHKYRQYPYQ